ncbi:carotenoid oxygenase [Aspergillus unguis]
MADIEASNATTHFNDWPNDQGFDANYEQKTPIELSVTGYIPLYAAGTLYRTGPGRYKVDTEHGNTFQVSHWFDGFSQTHRFQLVTSGEPGSPMRVLYNSRFSTDDLIEHARKTGSLEGKFSFGGFRDKDRDPCKTIYRKVQTTYEPRINSPSYSNTGVTLSVNMPGVNKCPGLDSKDVNSGGKASQVTSLYAKTDNSSYKQIDPETLEPISLADQTTLHPDLDGRLSASHARSDPETGDMYNYNLSFSPAPTYRVFRVSAATGKTTILATFPGIPSYMHSFFLTKDHVIICIWNAHLNPRDFANGSYVGALKDFDDSIPAKWYVIDRRQSHGQGLVAVHESPPFFCFHTINAWQETIDESDDPSRTQTDIVAECVVYENADVIKRLYYECLLSSSPEAQPSPETWNNGGKSQSRIARFRLPAIPPSSTPSQETVSPRPAILESTSCQAMAPELPTLNPAYITHPHRYTYAPIDRGYSTLFDGLMKFNSVTGETIIWSEHAQSAGEAIFVRDPEGKNEDDGVLLSVVLDGLSGKSYLLVLDAHDMKEVGRASVDGVVALGFHGLHVSGSSSERAIDF